MLNRALTTALLTKIVVHAGHDYACVRNIFRSLLSSPSLHGGRGALPSEGGHPSDLTYLAGGGQLPNLFAPLAPLSFHKKRYE